MVRDGVTNRVSTTFLERFLSYTNSKYFCETSDFGPKKWYQFEESPTEFCFIPVFCVGGGNKICYHGYYKFRALPLCSFDRQPQSFTCYNILYIIACLKILIQGNRKVSTFRY